MRYAICDNDVCDVVLTRISLRHNDGREEKFEGPAPQ